MTTYMTKARGVQELVDDRIHVPQYTGTRLC